MTPRAVPIELDGRPVEAFAWGPLPGDAPTIVLLHEGLGCVALWRDFPEKLARHLGCGVLAYSRFGYGQSAGDPLPWPPSYLHDHARDVLPRVLAAAGIGRHVLLGHSDGGSIAAIAAGTDPRCAGVIMLAAHFFVEDISIAAIQAAGVAYQSGLLRTRLARYHRDVDNAFLGWHGAWLDPAFRALDLSPELAAIRAPVLAMQGEQDEYGTPAQLDLLHRVVQAPLETILIPGARHAAHEQATDTVLVAITRFLQDNSITRRWTALARPQSLHYSSAHRGRQPMARIDFQTDPTRYRHWKLTFDAPVATLSMDVDPAGGLFDGYELKLNSYDLGVDIELADALQRLRFEHPEIRAVLLRSAKEGVFCAGANIRMLGKASHAHKVNFCKFTNETRLSIEDSSENSKQFFVAAVSGTAAGGGYELAVCADHIMLIDDRRSGVSLPETPLLAVLPGTGGLTRLTDKRRVRRDLADVFCSTEEGVRGKRAVEWRIVDEVVTPSGWQAAVQQRAADFAAKSDRPADAQGIALTPLDRTFTETGVAYSLVRVEIDRAARRADITIRGPAGKLPTDLAGIHAAGVTFYPLCLARELDDAILHLRANEPQIGLIVFRTEGEPAAVLAADALLETHASDWLVREIRHYLKRVLKRVDMTSRSLIALIEPGSCFAGTLAELAFAADRAVIFVGSRTGDNKPPATVTLSQLNFGAYPMGNGLTRLQTRFLGEPDSITRAQAMIGRQLEAADAEEAGLVTFAYEDVDWDDEVRIMLEERASFSPDALTGMEANLRFAGPETMETRIFGRLTAWQNWIFQRPNAVGEEGALKRYGSGVKPTYNQERV